MPTQRQLAANRRNAKKCTGPRTAEGKARSSRNNLKHGLYSNAPVLPGEDPAARASLAVEFQDAYPVGHIPLIDELTESEWLLRRYSVIEGTIWNNQPDSDEDVFATAASTLSRIDRYRNHATRKFRAALNELGNPEFPTAQTQPIKSGNPKLVSSRAFGFPPPQPPAVAYNL